MSIEFHWDPIEWDHLKEEGNKRRNMGENAL